MALLDAKSQRFLLHVFDAYRTIAKVRISTIAADLGLGRIEAIDAFQALADEGLVQEVAATGLFQLTTEGRREARRLLVTSSPVAILARPPGVFLSHSHSDKEFVRRLAGDLRNLGVRVWEAEGKIDLGDSLIEKISQGIDEMDFLVVVLSPDAVQSEWVRREVEVAMTKEIEGGHVRVLPLLYRECELPGFLKGKLHADFTKPENYQQGLGLLARKLRVESE